MNALIDIKYFNEIVKGIKAMKSDLVCINNNVLIGTDNTNVNLKVYTLDFSISLPSPICIITKELKSDFYSNITDTVLVFDYKEGKIYCPNNKTYAETANVMFVTDIAPNLISRYNNLVNNIIYNDNIKFIDFGNVTDHDFFKEYNSLKSSDGAKLYIPNNCEKYSMYLYKGALPINKSDYIEMGIFDEGETFITRFTIFKKKLKPIYVYFKYVKLSRA